MSWDDVEDEQVRQGVKKIFNDAGYDVGYNRMDHLKADIEATTYKMFGRDNRGYQDSAEADARIAAQERKNKELKAEMDYMKYQMWQAEKKREKEEAERERKEREEKDPVVAKWERVWAEEQERKEREEAARRWEAERPQREEAERQWEAERPQREEAERQLKLKQEQERLAREEAERQRLEAERLAKEEAERQRLERERLAEEEAEWKRVEREWERVEWEVKRQQILEDWLSAHKRKMRNRTIVAVLVGAVIFGGLFFGASAWAVAQDDAGLGLFGSCMGMAVVGTVCFFVYAVKSGEKIGCGEIIGAPFLGCLAINIPFGLSAFCYMKGLGILTAAIGAVCGALYGRSIVTARNGVVVSNKTNEIKNMSIDHLKKNYGDPAESAKVPAP